jgi:DNA uptake protein ComE-like DNA-binding protein
MRAVATIGRGDGRGAVTDVAHPGREPVWRDWVRSWWVLLSPLMWLNWTAFLYAGLRTHHRRWIAYAVVYLAVSAASIVLIASYDEDTRQSDAGAWIGLFSWGVSFVHALVIRREFLDRVEALEDPRLEAAEDRLRRTELARRIAAENPRRARRLGIGRPDVSGAFHGDLVDVNHASIEAVERLPGIDKRLAGRIVGVREEIDGFSSLEDLGHVLDLPASTVDRLRDRTLFLPR